MNEQPSTDRDKLWASHLEYVAERVNLLFAYHLCTLEFERDVDFTGDATKILRAWSLKTIQNACLHTSLIALRNLDDFFTPRNAETWKDDLRASDFEAGKTGSFLSTSERDRINKLIAHTTLHGSSNVDYKWKILAMIERAVAQSLAFLELMKTKSSVNQFNTWTAAIIVHSKTKELFEHIKNEAETRKPRADGGGQTNGSQPVGL